MIILPIKRKWFDLIKSGVKTEEYREIKPYYDSRFKRYFGNKVCIMLRNGYSRNSPSLMCDVIIKKGIGKSEWGAPDEECYILEILKVFGVKDED